ncbi:hemerythrin domain-containing protein [Streptomyces sp. NPDC049577]|uniref:hemerythrin domain-containing protein n=1 Tax=Streptomyces sp. NPDC049577 TaxID=3155153 RepID=UPI003448C3EE
MTRESDVIKELEIDHRAIEELFAQMHRTRIEDPARETLLAGVADELVRHSAVERRYLYPALREHLAEGDATAAREIRDQSRLVDMLSGLESCTVTRPGFDARVRSLEREVSQHISHEEHMLFPRLRQACPPETLDRLGDEVRGARAQVGSAG